MSANWIHREWEDLCQRLRRCADARDFTEFQQQAEQFASQSPPSTYQEVLDRVRDAANLATAAGGSGTSLDENRTARLKAQSPSAEQVAHEKAAVGERSLEEETSPFDPEHGIVDALDEAGMETFPASDPSAHY